MPAEQPPQACHPRYGEPENAVGPNTGRQAADGSAGRPAGAIGEDRHVPAAEREVERSGLA